MNSFVKNFNYLFRPVDGATLAVFRICFGFFMLAQVYHDVQLIPTFFSPDVFHFTYPFFDWVKPWPGHGMSIHMLIEACAALGILLGFCFRFSAILFFLTYSYTFLIESAEFQNHYYLIILFSFLFIFLDANARYSLDAYLRWSRRQGMIPQWNLIILRVQIVIVYFFAGVAKINHDWLHGEPVHGILLRWISKPTHDPVRSWGADVIGPYVMEGWLIYLLIYGGLIFDLSIGFLLWNKITRAWAIVAAVLFHLVNKFFFFIGIFPWLMISTLILFVDEAWFSKMLGIQPSNARDKRKAPASSYALISANKARWTIIFIGIYLSFQVLIPLRHFLIPGNVLWTQEGRLFSWEMKNRMMAIRNIEFWISFPGGSQISRVDLSRELSRYQVEFMAWNPQLILQYAHHIRDQKKAEGIEAVIVTVNAEVSLNGRQAQDLIDPNVNLANERYSPFTHARWILPLNPDLPIGQYYFRPRRIEKSS